MALSILVTLPFSDIAAHVVGFYFRRRRSASHKEKAGTHHGQQHNCRVFDSTFDALRLLTQIDLLHFAAGYPDSDYKCCPATPLQGGVAGRFAEAYDPAKSLVEFQ